jgi:hypothetical protein
MICTLFNQAVASGLSVVRMWGHTITPGFAFQTSPGQYREDIFQAFDFILVRIEPRPFPLHVSLILGALLIQQLCVCAG